jgi:hypothetical protein
MKTFQKIKRLLVLATVVCGFSIMILSCSSDSSSNYTCATCAQTPDALAENDALSKGIYKGIMVGSSGTISINIQNGSDTVTATLILDGTTILLTSTITPTTGQSYVSPFTGTYNGSPISITFSVAANGSSPTIVTSDIPGHPNASFQVYKETSTSLIEAFEGTYTSSGGESGIFNIILSRELGSYSGIAKENGTNQTSEIEGYYEDNGDITNEDGTVIYGRISGDELRGSFRDEDNDLITITGQRTL